ncbi:nucleotide sugar dehydrogenase [Candidatus Saccharibacteria bacterium]|nr:nucleotide sugar dehydrogenase [Candidatus Saccharibacteria bacterium]
MNITVVGTGYVGLSNAVLLAQHNNVIALDIVQERVDLINSRKSPIIDIETENYLSSKKLSLRAVTNINEAYNKADYVIIATPTNYVIETEQFDTATVEKVIHDVRSINSETAIIIKSTVPVGFTKKMREEHNTTKIIFSPEFLREGKALYDNLHPSRIIVGDTTEQGKKFAELMVRGAIKKDIPVLLMASTEAEAVKLFANTYLAMRVAYFNELDTYAEVHHLDAANIIDGVCLDARIGDYYNNPSFGYGGYCLPKDTRQLLTNFHDVPNNLIRAIVEANNTRTKHVADMILRRNPQTVGIYRLTMKKDSDNFRQSAIQGVIHYLSKAGIKILIHEPTTTADTFLGHKIENGIKAFKEMSDVIVANRLTPELEDIAAKIYSRDLFSRD